jgi:hypothetical protein
MSFTLPTWIAAIATVVLAVGAGLTVWYAKKAFDLQSQELAEARQDRADQQALNRQQIAVLSLQAQDLRASLGERERAATLERDRQARQVIGWQEHFTSDPRLSQPETALYGGKPVVAASVQNTSSEPVYDVRITWHRAGSPEGEADVSGDLMPGDTTTLYREPPEHAVYGTLGADVRFRDARGVRWQRTLADGVLNEVLPEQDEQELSPI